MCLFFLYICLMVLEAKRQRKNPSQCWLMLPLVQGCSKKFGVVDIATPVRINFLPEMLVSQNGLYPANGNLSYHNWKNICLTIGFSGQYMSKKIQMVVSKNGGPQIIQHVLSILFQRDTIKWWFKWYHFKKHPVLC